MILKKLTSIICVLTMVLMVISMPAAANTAATEKYLLIDDQFGDGDVSGWVQKKNSETAYNTFTTELIEGNNYALTYSSTSSTWSKDFIKREIPGGAITLTDGVNVVIETRIKQDTFSGSDSNGSRSFFKYNLESDIVDGYTAPEYNYLWGGFFVNSKGTVFANSGWGSADTYSYPANYLASNPVNNIATGALDDWYKYKIVFHGSTGGTANKASYYIYDDTGTLKGSLENVSIDFPDNSNWTGGHNGISWVEDVIENFAFRFRGTCKISVDYFKVWQEGIKVTAAEAAADLKNVNVRLTSNGELLEGVADYIKLYEADGITEVQVKKTYNAETKTVTFASAVDFPAGAIYKVKADKSALLTGMLYTWEAAEELTVEAPACAAINLSIKGELAPGTELEAVYDLMPEDSVEGASEFIWYTVAPDGTKTPIEGETGKTFAVTEDYVDSVITYAVKPQCNVDGIFKDGVFTNCSVTANPLSVPVASNLQFSAVGAMIGESLTAVYDFTDEDEGDEESGSVITWYVGSSAESEDYEPFETGKTITVTNDLNGKYLKYTIIPRSDAIYREEGELVWSDAIGPVSDVITASNLLTNPGLESGELSPWVFSGANNYLGITLTDSPETVYEGSYAIHYHSRMEQNDRFKQMTALEANKIYILSAMLKSTTEEEWTGVEGYIWDATAYEKTDRDSQKKAVGSEWTRVSLTFTTTAAGNFGLGFVNWSAIDLPGSSPVKKYYPAEMYIDNFYVGELRVSDIATKTLEPVIIPQGDETITVSPLQFNVDGNAIIYNQFGETDGLTKQTATLSVPEGTRGIIVEDNKIVINSDAVAGTHNIYATVIPKWDNITTAQESFIKEIQLELLAHNNKTPEARNIDAAGSVKTGNVLTGSYDFYQVDGKSEASEIKWLYSDSENGTYQPIPGAIGMTYVVTSAYADKFIKFSVTPKTTDGLIGATATSVVLAQPTAPTAKDVSISGDFKVGGTVNGDYEFIDINRDDEGTSTYRWYVADAQNGEYTAIPDATGKKLVLTSNLTDKFIKFGVTPVSTVAPYKDEEVLSEAFRGPVAPEARDVIITVNGKKLSGNYTYYHEHGARELKSEYKWTVDGKAVSTATNYIVNFVGSKTVAFTVTPVGDTNPGVGKSVTVSVVINGTSGNPGGNTSVGGIVGGGGSSSGGGGGGVSGGGAIAGGVISINDLDYGIENSTSDDVAGNNESDLDGHWGEEYIKKMVERGVMTPDENGNYNPDELVNRKDMLTFLFKTLKLETTKYSGMFSDVEDGEFAGMLQTMVDNGTISVDTTFRPEDSISREEMCKILYISLVNAGKFDEIVENPAAGFSDYEDISDWALPYVNAIYSIKMMIGVSDERFAPKDNVTKAQAATMLTRIISWVEGE